MLSSGLKDFSKDELVGLVEQLLEEVSALRERVCALEAENAALCEENTRLKGLKGRPKLKPSGMEEATNRPQGKSKRRKKRASCRSSVVNEEHKLSMDAPAGSRFEGYDDFVAQELRLLTGDVDAFCDEAHGDEAHGVLRAGLKSADWITVDDTGARHRNRNGVTTQIGDDRFTFFRTTFSKRP